MPAGARTARPYLLATLCGVAVLPSLFALPGEIWEGDPSGYAEVARRMVVSGDWLHLYDNFGPFLNKPPLALWGIAVFVKLLGSTSLAVHLPALLFGLLLLAATARIGRLLWSLEAGLSAAALLA